MKPDVRKTLKKHHLVDLMSLSILLITTTCFAIFINETEKKLV